MKTFSKGDKVICTSGLTCPVQAKKLNQAIKNEDYTVKKYEVFAGVAIVYLEGFKRGIFFYASRFRPLHDDVSNRIIKEVGSYPKYLN